MESAETGAFQISSHTVLGFTRFTRGHFSELIQKDAGGEGIFYAAKHDIHGNVMIKMFPYPDKYNEQEVKIMVKVIGHQNIVRLLGSFFEDGTDDLRSGYVMEFMANGSLSAVIHDLSIEYDDNQVYSWIQQAGRGIAYLHSQNIIHHDVNTRNMLLGETINILKISDFRLAQPDETTTEKNTCFMGTIVYTAPEVIEGQGVSSAADVYSLGISTWEMFHRKKPFCEHYSLSLYSLGCMIIKGTRPKIELRMEEEMKNLILRSLEAQSKLRPKASDFTTIAVKLRSETNVSSAQKASVRIRRILASASEAPPLAEEQRFAVVNVEPSPPPPLLPQEAPSIPIDPTPEPIFIPEPQPHPPTPLRPIQRRPILPVVEETLGEFKEADFCDIFSPNSYIGGGSGGCVYRRKHPTFGKVAVKLLKNHCREHSKIREITSALIRHPGIVNFYGFLYHDEKLVGFVMEYLETDLENVILDTNYTYSLVQLVDWMVEIAGTLAEMHKRRIVHRDIKPANILLHYDEKTNSLGAAKLCDFGLSREISSRTKTYGIGTKNYMAPEIRDLQEDPPLLYNEKVDVFSLGIVLWELLHRRFRSDRDKSLDPIFYISPKPRNVMESCMSHDPDRRPTMTELKKQLEEI